MKHIFVSHAEKDSAFMHQVAKGLEAAGYPTWYFERDVHAGTSYLIQIAHAVEDCEAFVLIASPNALTSDQVTKEVVGAFERRKQFFPVLVDMTPPELKERQYEWRHALGGTTMITMGAQGTPAVIDQIIAGLKARGIQPESGVSAPSPTHTLAATPEAERKQVTVMFADIAGFTAMSERMDPEEISDIMKACFAMMEKCIEEYGGTIDKFIGDCVMALFGAPKALEDAPHRSIETALEIRKRLQGFNAEKHLIAPLGIHIGINTGPVIAGLMGGDKRQDFTVMGDTVNLASRMEDVAETGDILVAEDTYRLTEGYFDFAPMGEVPVKGKAQPVKTWKVLGPRRIITRIDAGHAKGLSPFVGRGKEIEHLRDRLDQAREGRGQVVGVVGEPGVGKSRLIRQFRNSFAPSEVTCIEGGCLHFGDAIPYLPILDILKDYFAMHEDDDDAAMRETMAAKVAGLGTQLAHILPPLHEILSLKVEDEEYARLDARQRRERVFEAIRLLLVAESQVKPLVVIIEDLHWIDKTSEELLAYLINGLASTRILLVLLFRPGYNPAWVTKTYYSQVRVDQLSHTASRDLVQGIIVGTVDTELADFIVARTEGNPLFIEELISSLLESGSIRKEDELYRLALNPSDIQVPATIQGIIAARLDRLEGRLKGIMQTASVIGREFAFRILQAVASLKEDLKSSLLSLQDLELIYEKNIFPELEYIFKHALTQEVAYNSLLIKKRKETHARVGLAIELLYADRLEEYYEMLAYHFSMSERSPKAVHYLMLSGDKAAKNYANWEALRFYKEALRMLDTRPEDDALKREKVELLLRCNMPLFLLGYPQDSLELLQRAETLAQELGDQRALPQFHRGLSLYYTFKGDLSLGVRYAEQCFNEAELVEDMDLVVQSADQLCFAYFMQGNMLGSADVSRRAIDLFERHALDKSLTTGGLNVYALLLEWHGGALTMLGHLEEAKTALEKGIRNAHEFNDWYLIGMGIMMLSILNQYAGNSADLIAHAREAIPYYEKGEVFINLGLTWSLLGVGYSFQGEHATAKDYAEKGLTLQKETGLDLHGAYCYWFLSYIHFAAGNLVPARKACAESLKVAQETRARHIEGIASILLGAIAAKEDLACYEEARSTIQHGLAILEELQLMPSFAIGYLFLGEFYADAGLQAEAQETLKKAESLYVEMHVPPESYWLARIRDDLARIENAS